MVVACLFRVGADLGIDILPCDGATPGSLDFVSAGARRRRSGGVAEARRGPARRLRLPAGAACFVDASERAVGLAGTLSPASRGHAGLCTTAKRFNSLAPPAARQAP